MRKQFFAGLTEVETKEAAPWAAVVWASEGGCWAFESVQDAETWQAQV